MEKPEQVEERFLASLRRLQAFQAKHVDLKDDGGKPAASVPVQGEDATVLPVSARSSSKIKDLLGKLEDKGA